MTIQEKKTLIIFGCPSRETTVQQLRLAADLSPELTVKKALIALADKLIGEGVDEWYRCFFYNMRLKLEMEAYFNHKTILKNILGDSMDVEKKTIILFNEREGTTSIYTYNASLKQRLAAFSKKYPGLCMLEKSGCMGGVPYLIDKS